MQKFWNSLMPNILALSFIASLQVIVSILRSSLAMAVNRDHTFSCYLRTWVLHDWELFCKSSFSLNQHYSWHQQTKGWKHLIVYFWKFCFRKVNRIFEIFENFFHCKFLAIQYVVNLLGWNCLHPTTSMDTECYNTRQHLVWEDTEHNIL